MKINFQAVFNKYTGYGNASMKMAKWLSSIGNQVRCQHEPASEFNAGDEIGKLMGPAMEGWRKVNHCIPREEKFDALWTISEFTPVSYNWKYAMDNCTTLMTQSKFSKACLESVTNHPIEIVPNGIELSFGLKKPKIGLPNDPKNPKFRFLSVFEWVPRKQGELLIRSFCEEFKPTDGAELWIRSWNAVGNPLKQIPWIARDYPEMRKSIFYIKTKIEDMQLLYPLFDGYVLPVAGEGFGLTFMEAMACGLKPIGPNHGGSLEFMNASNSYLVDCGDWELLQGFGAGVFPPGAKWRVPMKDKLKAAMRTAFEKREHLSKGQVMSLKTQWQWENAAKKMQKVLEK